MANARDDEVDGDAGPKDAAAQPSRQPRRIRRFQEVGATTTILRIKSMLLSRDISHWAHRAKVQIKWNIATFRNSVHIESILKRRGLKLLAAEI